MQSLADLLQFLLRQSTPDGTFGSNGTTSVGGEPENYAPSAPPDTNAPTLENPSGLWPAFGLSNVPLLQSDSPAFQSPPWNVASSGGILGGHPTVTGSGADGSQPLGILYPYDDPRRPDSSRNQLGVVAPPIATSPSGNFPVSTRAPTTTFWSSPGVGSAGVPPLRGTDAPRSWSNQHITDTDFPQTTSSGSPGFPRIGLPEESQPSRTATQASDFPNAETYRPLGIGLRIHHAEDLEWSDRGTDDGWIAPSPGLGEDWHAYLRPAQVIDPSAVTGDPRIDRTSEFLLSALAQAIKEMGTEVPAGTRPTVFGTRAHVRFAQLVKALDLPGIGQDGVEQSWSLLRWAEYGSPGSYRTDVYLRDEFGKPIAIWDLKTGNAQLMPRRIAELRKAVGVDNIPVFELSWRAIMALRR